MDRRSFFGDLAGKIAAMGLAVPDTIMERAKEDELEVHISDVIKPHSQDAFVATVVVTGREARMNGGSENLENIITEECQRARVNILKRLYDGNRSA